MQHCLIYFPDYAHANPYQAMLYASIDGAFSARPGTIESALEALGRADWTQRTIFHLHWEDAIYRHLSSSDAALEECRRFLDEAEQFIHDGGLFVWTIHNRTPHDGRYLDVHQQLCAKLAVLAQQIHVHSYTAGAELVRDRHLDRSKLAVIPHGNYAPIYGSPEAHESAPQNGRRFLLFGRLGRYKGSAELVRAFLALPDRRAELVIAGKQIDPIDFSALPSSVAARITTHNRFLEQAEIPDLVARADFMVAPYLASLTSGTLLLAMSLGKPVIAPRLPTLAELIIDGENGLLFDPHAQGSLTAALERACTLDASELQRLSEAAFDTAMRYDWRIVGNLWSGLLYRLVTRPRVRRVNAQAAIGTRTPSDCPGSGERSARMPNYGTSARSSAHLERWLGALRAWLRRPRQTRSTPKPAQPAHVSSPPKPVAAPTNPAPATMLVTVLGLSGRALEEVLELVMKGAETKPIVPVFVTDTFDFASFRRRRLRFEYVPDRDRQQRFAPELDWDLYLRRRYALLREKWQARSVISFGSRPPCESVLGGHPTQEHDGLTAPKGDPAGQRHHEVP